MENTVAQVAAVTLACTGWICVMYVAGCIVINAWNWVLRKTGF